MISVLVLTALGYFSYVLIRRAARRRAKGREELITTPGAVQEGRFIQAGGIPQWITIRGEDRANPVILVLHGGPATSYIGMPQLFRAWERHFTVVQWDRRGVGKTFGRNGARGCGEMTLEQIAADGFDVAQFLRVHLEQDKVILLGHSMGSMIGVIMAARRPDLFHAYVGTEQLIQMQENEAVSYRVMCERALELGDAETVAKLRSVGPPPYTSSLRWGRKQQLAQKADPTYGAIAADAPGQLWTSPQYRLRDLMHLVGGMRLCLSKLYAQWMAFDARKLGLQFALPVFIIEGDTDVMTPPELARRWLDEIRAPIKQFVPLADASHLSFVTAKDAYLRALLEKVRPLAMERKERIGGGVRRQAST